MTPRRLRAASPLPAGLREGFEALRGEAGVPDGFPDEVTAAAARSAAAGPAPADREDLRDIPFVTVDPPGSRDLDQALHISRDGDGFLLRYAIADVAAFVPRGGPVDAHAWERGATLYLPDARVPLYPPALSEGAASLLPDGDRPAVVFTIPVAADGTAGEARVRRATVRSRARLSYAEVDDRTVPLLRDIGTALEAAAARRGSTRIDLPEQEVEPAPTAEGFVLAVRERRPSEEWNAQVSLCANVAAARRMWAAGGGLFRVMEPTDPARAAGLRAAAIALGFRVPDDGPAALAAIGGPAPAVAEFHRTARASGGAGYRAVTGPDGPEPRHAAVAAPYAHATAPLRRLADRYVLDLLVEIDAGGGPGAADMEVLDRLAGVMDRADTRADRLEAAAIDLVEATLLRHRVGEVFAAVVTGSTESSARIQLRDPPVRATVPDAADLPAGTAVEVRLEEADPARRTVRFRLAG